MQTKNVKFLLFVVALALIPLVYHLWPALRVIDEKSPNFIILRFIPIIIFGLSAFLVWRLHQIRSLLVMLALTTVYIYTEQIFFKFEPLDKATVLTLTSLSIPLSFFLLFTVQESRLLCTSGLIKIIWVTFPTLFLGSLLYLDTPKVAEFIGLSFSKKIDTGLLSHWSVLGIAGLLATIRLADSKHTATTIKIIVLFMLPFLYLPYANLSGRADIFVTYLCGSLMFLFHTLHLYWIKSYIDDLTEVPNRRSLDEHLKLLPRDWSIAMVDVDHFKKFNDRHGHIAGDQALRMIAAHLARESRGQVYRYGGEEFAILYKSSDVYSAAEYCEEMVDSIANRYFYIRRAESHRRRTTSKDRGKKKVSSHKRLRLTISVGITEKRQDDRDPYTTIERADRALYKAKKKGRNQVIVKE